MNSSLLEEVANNVSIPVVGHGGVGSKEDVLDLARSKFLSGIAIASLFHYDFIHSNRSLEGYEAEGNTEFLKSYKKLSNIKAIGVNELKKFLSEEAIELRKAV